jgi:hypothetical protein
MHTYKNGSWTKLYDGTEIIGTEEACKAEMSAVWKRVQGEEGGRMREAMKRLRSVAEENWLKGQSRKTMEGIAQYF